VAKLLRKDVLKWIRVLGSGRYRKGKEKLVSNDGTKFCCLGVWADIHGAVWDGNENKNLVPMAKGREKPVIGQGYSYVIDPKLTKGLQQEIQSKLADENDTTKGFRSVIAMIKKEVLPLAK
jgi:hypothetical protein